MRSHRDGSLGRIMAAGVGGLAIGIVGSRFLPPVLAGATGLVRATLGEAPFERLKQDHRDIVSLLERMQQAPDDSRVRRVPLFLSLKRTIGKHALAEEDVVYPLLHETMGAAEAARRLYSEHAEIKIHLYQIETALRRNASWAEHVRTLRGLIERHAREEEEVEFPRLQERLDARRTRVTSGQIRREEAMLL